MPSEKYLIFALAALGALSAQDSTTENALFRRLGSRSTSPIFVQFSHVQTVTTDLSVGDTSSADLRALGLHEFPPDLLYVALQNSAGAFETEVTLTQGSWRWEQQPFATPPHGGFIQNVRGGQSAVSALSTKLYASMDGKLELGAFELAADKAAVADIRVEHDSNICNVNFHGLQRLLAGSSNCCLLPLISDLKWQANLPWRSYSLRLKRTDMPLDRTLVTLRIRVSLVAYPDDDCDLRQLLTDSATPHDFSTKVIAALTQEKTEVDPHAEFHCLGRPPTVTLQLPASETAFEQWILGSVEAGKTASDFSVQETGGSSVRVKNWISPVGSDPFTVRSRYHIEINSSGPGPVHLYQHIPRHFSPQFRSLTCDPQAAALCGLRATPSSLGGIKLTASNLRLENGSFHMSVELENVALDAAMLGPGMLSGYELPAPVVLAASGQMFFGPSALLVPFVLPDWTMTFNALAMSTMTVMLLLATQLKLMAMKPTPHGRAPLAVRLIRKFGKFRLDKGRFQLLRALHSGYLKRRPNALRP